MTWLNYMSDQFSGLHAIVVPGTLCDSLMILDGLLELQPPGDGGPTMIITDQASYSDQIFGLFWLLGYQFSPRPAGLPDQRFWRLGRHADYGPLDRLARHRINIKLIIEQWEDILRVAGSLSTGTVRASELIRVLQGGGHPTRLGRAIAELGRVAKTLHLLSWIDNEEHRRQSSVGLTRHEGRHSVARIIFHGNRGELRQPYREGREDQLGALGFALNALVLWNAQYLDDAIVPLRATGHDITDEDLQRLSPLQYEHIKMLGNFPFTLPAELAAGQRRQLRGLGTRLPVPLLPEGRPENGRGVSAFLGAATGMLGIVRLARQHRSIGRACPPALSSCAARPAARNPSSPAGGARCMLPGSQQSKPRSTMSGSGRSGRPPARQRRGVLPSRLLPVERRERPPVLRAVQQRGPETVSAGARALVVSE